MDPSLFDTLPSEQIINADKQILANTDYNLLKALEHILQADSLDELMLRVRYAREHYAPQLELRSHCRNEINEAEITLVQEQEARDTRIQEMLAAEEQPVIDTLMPTDSIVIGTQNEELQ